MANTQPQGDFLVEVSPPNRIRTAHLRSGDRLDRAAPLALVNDLDSSGAVDHGGISDVNLRTGGDRQQGNSTTTTQEPQQIEEAHSAGTRQDATILGFLKTSLSAFFFPQTARDEEEFIDKLIILMFRDEEEFISKHEYDQFIDEKVLEYPEGFPQLAALINSSSSFLVYRKFGRFMARILLHRQIEIADLLTKLDKLDEEDALDDILKPRLHGHTNFIGWNDAQQKLLAEAEIKLASYGDLLLTYSKFEELGSAPKRNYLSLYHWIVQKRPLNQERRKYFRCHNDFVSLAKHSSKDRWAKNCLEGYLDSHPDSLLRAFLQTSEEHRRSPDDIVDYYSSNRMSFAGNLFIVIAGGALMLAPIFVLALTSMSRFAMCTLGGIAVMLSTTLLATITAARPHEMLFGMAAYSAVVFIFVGNMNTN